MTGTQLITKCFTRLGVASSNPFWTSAEMLIHINDGYKDFVKRTKCLKKFTLLDITADTTEYTLPSDNLQLLWAGYDNEGLIPTSVKKLDEIDENWIGRSGTPFAYVVELDGFDKIRLHNTPGVSSTALDAATTAITDFDDWTDNLLLFYEYEPADITAAQSPDLEVCFQWAIAYYALWKAFEKEGGSQHLELAAFYQKRYFEKVAEKKSLLSADVTIGAIDEKVLDPFEAAFSSGDEIWWNLDTKEYDDIVLPADGAIYGGKQRGDGTWPSGTWKIVRSGDDLVFYRYESSTWVEKGRATASG